MKKTLGIILLLVVFGLVVSNIVIAPPGNESPVADAGGPYSGNINEDITFDASGSYDPDGEIVSYRWDWTNDGIWDTDNLTLPYATYSYSSAGTYTVKLIVTDDGDSAGDNIRTDTDTSSVTVIVPDEPPIADFTYTPNIPTTQDIIQFTDTSTKGTYNIISWSWDFGDGEGSHLQNPTHQYSDDGTYNVTLTVMDEAGLEDDETKYITIGNTPPEAYFTYTPLNPTTADIIQFIDASTDVDGEIVGWLWDFGDGETSTLENPKHQYEEIGEIPVILRVEDDDMDFAFYDIKLFIYGANYPEANANGPYLGNVSVPIDFDGSGSSDPDGEIVAYTWDFGDGKTGTGVNPSHIYNEIGIYTVKLTVEDNDGYTDNDTTTAKITDNQNNPPNKPTVTGPLKGKPGEEYTYYAVTTDPDGDNISYLFNWGNNITSFIMDPYPSGVKCNASTVWFDEGTFNVTVKAIDVYSAESEWSDPLEVSMPKTKAKTIDILLLRILDNYPLLYKILHRFLKL